MSKILFIDGTPGHDPHKLYDKPTGGILTSLTHIPKYLVSKGHEVYIQSEYEKEETVDNIHYVSAVSSIPKPDIAVFNRNVLPKDYITALKQRGTKIVWWLHDIVDIRYLKDDAFRLVDKIVALSQYCKESYSEFYEIPKDKFVVIPNGVDKSIFYPGDYEKRNQNLVLMASALIKGWMPVELTYLSLKTFNPDLDLHIYSSQALHGKENSPAEIGFLKQMIKQGAKVRQPVPQTILADLMRKAWLFLMPNSYPEICSNLLLQAQACGLPVITSNIGSAWEFIDHGVTGVLTRHAPHDLFLWSKAYAEAAVLTANSPYHKDISDNAPKNVKSWQDIGEKWNELITTL